jgi:CMP-N,N'-diacetyllegionaminic acid synthase
LRSVGIIPARGGSKGIPRKNLANLGGVPLITYSIVAGELSALDKVYVSTEDSEITRFCHRIGSNVIRRPQNLATDEALTAPLVVHALEALAELGEIYDLVVLLQPTSPFRPPWVIDQTLRILSQGFFESVISVKKLEGGHPSRMCQRKDSGSLSRYNAEHSFVPRAELPEVFLRNGSVYAVMAQSFLKTGDFFSKNTFGLVLPELFSINLDAPLDLEFANFLLDRRDCQRELRMLRKEVLSRLSVRGNLDPKVVPHKA